MNQSVPSQHIKLGDPNRTIENVRWMAAQVQSNCNGNATDETDECETNPDGKILSKRNNKANHEMNMFEAKQREIQRRMEECHSVTGVMLKKEN